MQFYIKVKQLSKRRAVLEKQPFEIENLSAPFTLRSFIAAVVTQQVAVYNSKTPDLAVLSFLTSEQIGDNAAVGKVGFSTIYHNQKTDLDKAIANALLAFADGLYKVFIDDKEVQNLDNEVVITKESVVLFLRLTLLRT